MPFTLLYLAFILSTSTLSNALPLDGALRPRQQLAPRGKSYSIVNVDGGSTPALEPTTIVETVTPPERTKTETLEVTDVAPTVTDKITSIIVETSLATPPPPSTTPEISHSSSSTWGEPFHLTPDPTSKKPNSTSSPSPITSSAVSYSLVSTPGSTPQLQSPSTTPSATGEPSIVTVVITTTQMGPTEYYDNGLWHTSYAVKTFETVVFSAMTSSASTEATPSTTTVPSITENISTLSISLPTLAISSVQAYNQTQIPGRRRALVF
ncbi:hypothetical protein K469DRAFT_720478 [Zopfia rhizophila CBS 207.26]|uniref:REJ domain-containing protein n=1 Tax=Zopfia rhizophila CBS 207.26 TaxID=1314779 RepID=A0A6A6EJB0_9PEZI|nr:hypothetical protein K469DRAFT_720478 [Zopfia rhizophila CBS 207.26]